MATTAVRRISMITLAVVLCTTFIAVSLLLNPLAEGVANFLRCGETNIQHRW
jgi:4-hydroxybenzoate polyprenyltransferase